MIDIVFLTLDKEKLRIQRNNKMNENQYIIKTSRVIRNYLKEKNYIFREYSLMDYITFEISLSEKRKLRLEANTFETYFSFMFFTIDSLSYEADGDMIYMEYGKKMVELLTLLNSCRKFPYISVTDTSSFSFIQITHPVSMYGKIPDFLSLEEKINEFSTFIEKLMAGIKDIIENKIPVKEVYEKIRKTAVNKENKTEENNETIIKTIKNKLKKSGIKCVVLAENRIRFQINIPQKKLCLTECDITIKKGKIKIVCPLPLGDIKDNIYDVAQYVLYVNSLYGCGIKYGVDIDSGKVMLMYDGSELSLPKIRKMIEIEILFNISHLIKEYWNGLRDVAAGKLSGQRAYSYLTRAYFRENELESAEILKNGVKKYLKQNKIEGKFNKFKNIIGGKFKIDSYDKTEVGVGSVEINLFCDYFQILAEVDVDFDDSYKEQIAEYLTRLNFAANCVKFDLDYDDNKVTVNCSKPSEEFSDFENFFLLAISYCYKCRNGIIDIVNKKALPKEMAEKTLMEE